ncbi:MAG: sulfite exporter TauE/SafE family protein [Deltaproteobacteria bacterium]|nr:sulfite exporter TauE/SafE family protein [Deltaproteobacteria bacterium]
MLALFETSLAQGSLTVYVLAFVGGILASLTPCVYPMIPITVNIIARHAKNHLHAVRLSIIYVFGMVCMYTLLGIFAALTGKVFGWMTTNAIVYFLVSGVMFLFGAMEMGWIRWKVLQKVSQWPFMMRRRPGIFIMGVTSGLIAAPCTVPILGVILSYVASQQNLFLGATLMFVFSWGLGLLLFLVGIFTGFLKHFPRSGAWMLFMERVAGVFFFGLGAYFFYKALTI